MSNNKVILEGCINKFKENNEIEAIGGELFELFSLTQVFKNRNITYEDIENSIVDGSNDGGIDSVMIFIDENIVNNIDELENIEFSNRTNCKIILSQCKKENSFKESVLDKLITTIPIILDLEKNETALLSRFNCDLVSKVLILKDVWQKTVIAGGAIGIEFYYITNAIKIEVNGTFIEKENQLLELTENYLSSKSIKINKFSNEELLKEYQKQKLNRLSLEFKDRPLSIDYADGIGYIGLVKLSNYKQFLTSENTEIRDDLFESNIRHFQGLVDVNKKIKNTIEEVNSEDFWWLNNGITIIAEEPKEVGKKLSIENIQIVNGLQTSYSIFNNYTEKEIDERSVLVKVIINKDKEITDHIIASTNNQNPVSAALLRATEPIQRNLELFFSNEGYYYDRRKNYYKNLGKPLSKIFSIQYTAQSIESILLNEPHTARATPTSLLKNESTYKKIFDDKKDFKCYLNCCLITKQTMNLWQNYEIQDEKTLSANFKLHLACLILKVFYEREKINEEDISDINLSIINSELFSKTIKFLIENIHIYLDLNKDKNLINIAKSKDFTDFLFKEINNKYERNLFNI